MFGMKRKAFFLLIIIAVFMVVSFTYGQYYTLASADFISHGLKLETFDQELLIAAYASRLKILGSNGFPVATALRINLIEQILQSSFLTSPSQRTPVLRC